VEINGTVMVVARIDSRLHAMQEFCTHRYGPLSEAAIDGCELICPWHRSRFDVRNGKVTAGPAKIDLRTFKVESRDGKIWIEVPGKTG
jgi:nitrite reductase/ring-hydroxylating ferredoxin subunit